MKIKKLLFCFTVFLIPFLGISQIPSYYNDVDLNLTGQSLKDELATKVISTHTTFLSYTPGVWDALKQTDLDPNDNTKVLLIYGYDDNDGDPKTDRTRGVDMNGGNVGDWNREHVFAKSLGNPDLGTTGPGADAHHLRPCDTQWNSTRNNRKFADGSGNAGITGTFWYPGDEWKGDVARMMMYMYLRYGSQCLPINVGEGNPVSGDANMIDLFLQWNVDDPVSAFEDQRNPILEGIQGNRNPFIDNPAFATQIWGGPQAEDRFGTTAPDTEAPTAPTNLVASNITTNSVNLSWTASTDNVFVSGYDVYQDGVQIGTTSTVSFEVTGLTPDTNYMFNVYAKDAAGNVSGASNTISVTTNAGSGATASELFLSEYVEGSSYNKAIEIANFTGASVDLSTYSLRRNTNGGSSWGATYSLSGTLANTDVFVVAHSSSTSTIQNVADAITGADALTFNGNDPVGLFKNDVLIDIIGDFNGGTANFAANTTLRRKSSVLNPSTVYVTSEWDSYASDTFDDLGNHTVDGGSSGTDTEAPTAPTNIALSNITETTIDVSWTASTDNVAVTDYEVYIDGVLSEVTASTSATVTGLIVNTTYAITVFANDAAGNTSVSSTTVNGTTVDLTNPTAPSNLVASNITETTVDLSWTASTDNVVVTDYEVYVDGAFHTSTGSTSLTISGLTASTLYVFEVYAFDAAGNMSDVSNIVSATTESGQTSGPVVLHEAFFESGWDGWSDGGSDCARYSGSRSWEGSYSIRLRDNSGTSSAMTSETFDLSSYDTVDFEFYFYSYSMENGEDFFVKFYDGSSWVDVANYVSGTDFSNNNFYVASITLDSSALNFANNSQFRIQCDASNNSDYIYVDQVSITGNSGSTSRFNSNPSNAKNSTDVSFVSYRNTSSEGLLDKFTLYPNPVSGNVINVEIDSDFVNYRIVNMLGQSVKYGVLYNETIQLDSLKSGVYLIEFSDGEDKVTKKFVKQ